MAGTVILCDVAVTVTTSFSDIKSVDLSCKTLFDESLPPATEEELGQLTESVGFYATVGELNFCLNFLHNTGCNFRK